LRAAGERSRDSGGGKPARRRAKAERRGSLAEAGALATHASPGGGQAFGCEASRCRSDAVLA
jgi:hypothetical protein